MKNILLTVAARGGSKGVKNKNIRAIAGTPLIGVTLKQAKLWGKAKRIVVSTDSEEIAEVARKFEAEIPFLRPAELATDTAGKIPVLRHALLECERLYGETYDVIVDLDATAPIRTPQDLDRCFELFLKTKPKTLFSAVASHKSPYFNMVEVGKDGYATLSKKPATPILRRQDAPVVYTMNASIYFYDRNYLLDPKNNSAISDQSVVYEMDELSLTEVDREIDFKYLEFLVKEGVWKP